MSKIAFLFPGQGAQTVGMCRELDQELPAVRELFDRAGEILGIDLRQLCIEGPAEALEATDVSQPAIFVASLAALESLKVSNPDLVDVVRGGRRAEPGRVHGAGLRRSDGFRGRAAGGPPPRPGDAGRGRWRTPSGMTSVLGLDEPAVDELCRRVAPSGRLWKANLLGPGNIVVSGEAAALDQVAAGRHRAGCHEGRPAWPSPARSTRDLMKPADDQLAEVLAQTPISLAADPRLFQRRRRAPLRPRRHPPHPRGPGPPGRPLGRFDAPDARRRLRHLLRDRTRPRPHRAAQADRPQGPVHERPRAVGHARVFGGMSRASTHAHEDIGMLPKIDTRTAVTGSDPFPSPKTFVATDDKSRAFRRCATYNTRTIHNATVGPARSMRHDAGDADATVMASCWITSSSSTTSLQRTRARIKLTDIATACLILLVGFLAVLFLEVVLRPRRSACPSGCAG